MKGCQRLIFHAAHTPTFNRQIFQQSRFPSDASAYGCMIATEATLTQDLMRIGKFDSAELMLASLSLRPWERL